MTARGWPAVVLAASALMVAATTGHAARGSDASGYRWFDLEEPECPWRDITFVPFPGQFLYGSDDDISAAIPLGFDFPLYGVNYSQIWISTNGWLSVTAPASSAPIPGVLGNTALPNGVIAPLWSDLVPYAVNYGLVSNPDEYFVVRWLAEFKNRGWNFLVEARLHPGGEIVFVYSYDFGGIGPADRSLFNTGIEDGAGGQGLMLWNRGTGLPGYNFQRGHNVCIVPPPRLTCTTPPITCGQTINGSTAGAPRTLAGNGCSTTVLGGGERVYPFTLGNLTDVRATLSGLGGRDLKLYLLDRCNEQDCLQGGGTSIDAELLPAGDYALLVDGPLAAEGAFSLDLACTPRGASATCGTTRAGSIGSSLGAIDAYACVPGMFYPGEEAYFEFNLPARTNLRARVTASCEIEAFAFRAGDVAAGDCLGHAAGGVVLYAADPGNYLIVLEGVNGATCPYTVDFECGVDLACGAPVATLRCGDSISGSTVGAINAVNDYACRPGKGFDGGEAVYAVQVTAGPSVGVKLSNPSSPDLEAFLLASCDEGNCMDSGAGRFACDASVSLSGNYYAVVDGQNGATGTFDLEVVCGPSAYDLDWRACESPDLPAGTTLDTHQSSEWSFHTPLPSAATPDPDPSGSFCGSFCDFALYLPVNCASTLHALLQDVESAGMVSLTEARTGRIAQLEATNNGGRSGSDPWSDAGAGIDWLSRPCPSHTPARPPQPPDVGSDDPRFDGAAIDIAFAAGEIPCGLWRIDFSALGGVHWKLHANCDGGPAPGFPIHDNICDATAAFAPKPEFEVSNLRVTGTCPDLSVTFDLSNRGCAAADAHWSLDGGSGTPETGFIAGLGGGARVPITRAITVGGSGRIRAFADPDALVLECSEAAGELCVTAGVHQVTLQACSGCTTPAPPTAEIGNNVRAHRTGVAAELSWAGAPSLGAAAASHYHVYRSDQKAGGVWSNLPAPDLLVSALHVDPMPSAPLFFYQVRFASDCEDISGDALP